MNRISKTIDESLIENKEYFNHVKDDIYCSICLGLLNDPKLCQKCETPFCKECINKWKEKNELCPNRCSSIILVDIHRLLKNTLDKIKLNLSCGCQISLLHYSTHKTPCSGVIQNTVDSAVCYKCLNLEGKISEMEDERQKNDERIHYLIKELKLKNDELKLYKSECDTKILNLEYELRCEKTKVEKQEDELKILKDRSRRTSNNLNFNNKDSKKIEDGLVDNLMDQIITKVSGKIKNSPAKEQNKFLELFLQDNNCFEIPQMENKKSISNENEIYALCILKIKNKTHIAVGSDTSKNIQIYSLDTYNLVTTILDEASGIECICAMSFNDQTLVVSGGMQGVKLWSAESGKLYMTLHGTDEEPVDSLLIYQLPSQQNQDMIITGYDDGIIKVWNPYTKSIVMILSGHIGPIQSLSAFTINNQVIIASGGEEGIVKLWSTYDEKNIITFEENMYSGEEPSIYSLICFELHEKIIIASAGKEANIKLWSYNDGKLLRKLDGHDSGDDSCIYCLVT